MTDFDPAVMLGSAYYVNTEDTPDQVRSGIRTMAQAGLKLVRIFLQWTHVEPRQGRWDWSQYEAVFEAAAAGGLGIIVTLTALNPPGWMRVSSGPQDIGPLDDPLFWEQARNYIRKVCEHYASHPALHSWLLSNEPQLFLAQDEANLERFRKYLERVFAGDIAAFNRRSFRQLDSFDQFAFAGSGSEGGFSGYTEQLLWVVSVYLGYSCFRTAGCASLPIGSFSWPSSCKIRSAVSLADSSTIGSPVPGWVLAPAKYRFL
jgi:beta-galactosidase